MKVIKTLFSSETLELGKNDLDKFSPKTTPLKFRGNENEILHFGTFSVRDETFSKYISIKIFFLEEKYIFNLSPEFRKSSKM